jgi:LmbE family N-acetylglucosaminyl deacetylase
VIHIIEPHADDAFLSLGGHIANWIKDNIPVHIITVYSGTRKRGPEAEAYAKAMGASWSGLEAKERRGGGKPGDGTKAIRCFLSSHLSGDHGHILLPLAPKHPDHIEVREAVEAWHTGAQHFWLQYYLDQPYAAMTVNSPEINRLLSGMRVVSYFKPTIHKYKHIRLFKDQGRFWHFNPPESLKHNPELIVEAR